MDQLTRQSVFVIFIALDNTTSGAPATMPIAVEGVFVFLVRDERMNLATADERDMPGLGAAKIFLQENSLGVIRHAATTRACPRPVSHKIVWTGLVGEHKRILDDERLRVFHENFSASIRFDAIKRFAGTEF